jgi:hypothetical protein
MVKTIVYTTKPNHSLRLKPWDISNAVDNPTVSTVDKPLQHVPRYPELVVPTKEPFKIVNLQAE